MITTEGTMTIEQLKTEALLAVEHAQYAHHLINAPDDGCEHFKVDDGKNFFAVAVHRETLETRVAPW